MSDRLINFVGRGLACISRVSATRQQINRKKLDRPGKRSIILNLFI